MIKAIIFDCWNTLFVLSEHHFVKRLADLFKMEYNRDFLVRYAKISNIDPSRDKRSLALKILKEFKINITEESINGVMQHFTFSSSDIFEYPETLEVLKDLKKEFKIGLLTNVEPPLHDVFVEKYNANELFDAIVTSFDVQAVKPAKIMFQTMLDKLGENRDTTVMVGDDLQMDVRGAEHFGMTAYLIDRDNKNPHFERRITDLRDLKKMLK